MPFRSRLLSRAIIIAGLLAIAALWLVGSLLTGATNSKVIADLAPARLVHLKSIDGVTLAATYWPAASANAPAILLLHGNGGNRGNMAKTAALLAENGYAALAIDFRGHGESTPTNKSFGLFEADDAWTGFTWLRADNPDRNIGIIGYSLGGAASLIGKRGPIPADALVLEGVYPDIRHAIFDRLAMRLGSGGATMLEPLLSYQSLPRFGVWPDRISPLNALSKVTAPVMIVGGGSDTNTPPAETRAMFDVVRGHGELHILQGESHQGLAGQPTGQFKVSLLAFLDRTLKLKR
jgi:uncharacterized protein